MKEAENKACWILSQTVRINNLTFISIPWDLLQLQLWPVDCQVVGFAWIRQFCRLIPFESTLITSLFKQKKKRSFPAGKTPQSSLNSRKGTFQKMDGSFSRQSNTCSSDNDSQSAPSCLCAATRQES